MTIGIVVNCERDECRKPFIKTTHNQKYCTHDCTKIETNRKVKERYHERNAIRRGKKRSCSSCTRPLSRYNPGEVCNACEDAHRNSTVSAVGALVSSVLWL